MEKDPDAGLMRRVARGDDSAMADLVERWERPVLAFVRRFLACSADDARDLAQEVFLRVWRERRRWRPKARLSTWLFTIAGNLCRNRKRDLGRRPPLVPVVARDGQETSPRMRATDQGNPHHQAEVAELSRRVRGAVAGLPEAQRAAILLRHFEDLSYREIAAVLGTTPSAVDSLLVRARRSLAGSLLEEAQEKEDRGVERRCEELHGVQRDP